MLTNQSFAGKVNRRAALSGFARGFGLLGLAAMCGDSSGGEPAPHFPPKAKNVIFLFMSGGPSHVDLFDSKPSLALKQAKAGWISEASRGLGFRCSGERPAWLARLVELEDFASATVLSWLGVMVVSAHPDTDFVEVSASSTAKRTTIVRIHQQQRIDRRSITEQAKKHRPTAANDLCRNHQDAISKRGEVHVQQF